MRNRVSQSTFELMITSASCFEKTYRSNADVVPGYQYLIKEFDFIEWVETGRWVKLQVVEIFGIAFSPGNTLSSVELLNRKYKFFKSVITEVHL